MSSLLLLQLDSVKLRSQNLALGEPARAVAHLQALWTGGTVEVVEATNEASLLAACQRLRGQRFDVVLAIGHSNETGIQIAEDRFAEWKTFAAWLAPFGPRRLILAACHAGRSLPARELFTRLRDLRRIYASPVAANLKLGYLLIALLPYVRAHRRPPRRVIRHLQLAAGVLAGQQIREWMRKDKDNVECVLLDWIADAAQPYVQQLPGALALLFG
jgi:hypothetical protein